METDERDQGQLGRRRFLAALAGTVPVASAGLMGGAQALAQKPKSTPTPLLPVDPLPTPTPEPATPTPTPTVDPTPTPTVDPTPTPTPPPDEVYARLAAINTFTERQVIESPQGSHPGLLVRQHGDGPMQEWYSDDVKIGHVNRTGLRIFSKDGTAATDFADFRWAPDEFGLYNEATHRQADGTPTNGDIVFYAPWRIRVGLKNPHLSSGRFEIREMYESPPGPLEPEFIPWRVRHARPEWGTGVHDYFHIRPNFGRMGAAKDGYRVISVDLTADAPASVAGPRQLLRLAVAGGERFSVDNRGNATGAGFVKLGGASNPPADGDVAPGEVALWLDPTPDATKLRIKAKDSAGTVRTGAIDLQ